MIRRHSLARRVRACTLAGLLSLCATVAQAGLFPTYPTGTGAGVWEQDRYPPSGFTNAGTVAGRPDALALELSASDSQANRPPAFSSAFYNTQGRGFQHVTTAYAVIYGSIYIPAAWATTNPGDALLNRRSEMWGVLSPATGGDICPASNCNLFPYIGFSNASPSDPLNAGGTPRMRVWDTNVGTVDLATPVAYDQWADVCIAFTGTALYYYIGGAQVHVVTPLEQADPSFGPPNQWARSIVQAYNFGAGYTVNWSGLGAGTLGSTAMSGGDGQTAALGAAFAAPLAVIARDSGGTPLPCIPVTFAAPGAGASATLSATTVLTDRNGVASVNATANGTAGSYVVTATAPGLAAIPFNLTNQVLPTAIAATGGGGQSAPVITDFALPLSATVTGTGGVPVAGVDVTFTLPAPGASGTFPGGVLTASATTDALGVAVSPVVTANAIAGAWNATATVSGVALPATFALTNTVVSGAVSKSFAPSTVTQGDATVMTITLGNPNAAALTLAQPFTDALPAGMTATGGSSGTCVGVTVAASLVTLPAGSLVPAGGCTIVASVSATAPGVLTNTTSTLVTQAGTSPAASAQLTVQAMAVVPEGGNQTAPPGMPFANPLQAVVTLVGIPVPGVAVTFTLPASGPSGTFPGGALVAVVYTDSAGRATSPPITANGVGGPFTATASILSGARSVTFTLTNAFAPVATQPVPTLGEWALMLLVLLVAATSAGALRRKG